MSQVDAAEMSQLSTISISLRESINDNATDDEILTGIMSTVDAFVCPITKVSVSNLFSFY